MTIERQFTILPDINHMVTVHEDVMTIWLDDTIGTSIENYWFSIVGRLRQITSNVQVFTEVNKCLYYVRSCGIEKIFLIVAGAYGDDFDTRLFKEILEYVFIYVLTSNKLEYNDSHTNLRGYFDNTNKLVNQIQDDYKHFATNIVFDTNSIKMDRNGNTARCLNPQLISWKCFQLLKNLLRRMPCPRAQSMNNLIQFCKFASGDDPYKLQQINKFQYDYQSNQISCYTASYSFPHRLLNKTLRINDIDAIMHFSHILTDFDDKLDELYSERQHADTPTSGIVYCAGPIRIDEVENLKLNVGRYISNNTILVAFLNHNKIITDSSNGEAQNYTNFICEIFFDFNTHISKRFVALSSFSSFFDADEILFKNGTIFRLDSCKLSNNIWTIKIILCDDSNPITQNSSDYFDIATLKLPEILRQISPRTNKANDRLLQWWRLYCADDPIEQAKIDDFEKSYRSDSAIRWYTKNSLLYRLLNYALRHENMDMIIDFRYFIIDLYEQLTKSHLDFIRSFKEQSLTVYRGQKISLSEIRRLKHNIDNYISIKSLFSTSLSRDVALIYAELDQSDIKHLLQSVLFQIDIDIEKLAKSYKNHLFANIINMSYIADEEEVLFMANTQFRIRSVENSNKLWVVRLTLLNQDDENSEEMRIMNKYLNYLTNMITQHYRDEIKIFFQNMIVKNQ